MARLFCSTTFIVDPICTSSLGNSLFCIAKGRKIGGSEIKAAARNGPLYPIALKRKLPIKGLEAKPRVTPIWKKLWKSSIHYLKARESRAKPSKIQIAPLAPCTNEANIPMIKKRGLLDIRGRNAKTRIATTCEMAATVNVLTLPQRGMNRLFVRMAASMFAKAQIVNTRLLQRGSKCLYFNQEGKKGPRVTSQKKAENPEQDRITASILSNLKIQI